MSIKQIIKVLLLLAALVLCSLYMHRYFYESTVAYDLYGKLSPETVQNASVHYDKPSFQWEMYLGDKTLIMTTGNVQCHRQFSLEKPWFYPAKGEAILSEAVLSDLFKTGVANRQSFNLIDKHWVAAGSVKEGRAIYIGYDPELLNLPWNKTTFYYSVSDLKNLEITDEELGSFMGAYKIKIANSLYYRDYLWLYMNLGLGLLAFSLLKMKPSLELWLRSSFTDFKAYWHSSDRYSIRQKLEVLKSRALGKLILHSAACLIAIVAFFRLLSNMMPPRTLMPTNWFSPLSYYESLSHFLKNLSRQLSSGSSDLIFKQLICLVLLLLWALILERVFPKSKKTKL